MKTCIFVTFLFSFAIAQHSDTLKIHFLYGSRPAKKYKHEEKKWFGGILGGHVGVELKKDSIFSFSPSGSFHVFARRKPAKRHSTFRYDTPKSFYSILGGPSDSMKMLIVGIPIDKTQRKHFDSIAGSYYIQSPYDYAFFGYRCSAAAYDILAKLGITKRIGKTRTCSKIFYPRRLRKRVIRLAKKKGWRLEFHEGSSRRVWEGDRT